MEFHHRPRHLQASRRRPHRRPGRHVCDDARERDAADSGGPVEGRKASASPKSKRSSRAVRTVPRGFEAMGQPREAFSRLTPATDRMTRPDLVRTANMYFSGMQLNDGKGKYPFADDCNRIENGAQTTNAAGRAGQAAPRSEDGDGLFRDVVVPRAVRVGPDPLRQPHPRSPLRRCRSRTRSGRRVRVLRSRRRRRRARSRPRPAGASRPGRCSRGRG